MCIYRYIHLLFIRDCCICQLILSLYHVNLDIIRKKRIQEMHLVISHYRFTRPTRLV